ncbi:MAG TPA: hypothetical protein VFR68_14860, partial [Candidatus Dormibacteraeota bacterium]|nr:hypothetical protein [Candidatus Dormibacteraeota bacterium]
GEYLLTLDADGSHDPAVLADLWTARQLGEVVIASRYVEGGAAAMPGWRQLLSRMLNAAFRRGLSLPVRDRITAAHICPHICRAKASPSRRSTTSAARR